MLFLLGLELWVSKVSETRCDICYVSYFYFSFSVSFSVASTKRTNLISVFKVSDGFEGEGCDDLVLNVNRWGERSAFPRI